MLARAALADALRGAPLISVRQTFTRRVPLHTLFGIAPGTVFKPGDRLEVRAPSFLFTSGRPYRFTPTGIMALYVGEGESVAGAEVKQHPGAMGYDVLPRDPDALYHIDVAATAILDLTDEKVTTSLGTDTAELLGNWRVLSPAPTQMLGQAVYDAGNIEGIRYQSAAQHRAEVTAFCVVLFKDRKLPGSVVRVFDSHNVFSDNW